MTMMGFGTAAMLRCGEESAAMGLGWVKKDGLCPVDPCRRDRP